MSTKKPPKAQSPRAPDLAVEVPIGRPTADEEREPLRQIVFKASPKVEEAIEVIVADMGERGTQSVAIREAIMEKAARVRAKRKAPAGGC